MKAELTQDTIRLVRILQEEFPLTPRPFLEIAKRLECTEEEAIVRTKALQETKALKRISCALYHVSAGFQENSMVVWDIPEERLQEAGEKAAAFPQVTHCYARERAADFDYNLYTMVHETSKENMDALVGQLKEALQADRYHRLDTIRELKKTGMKYFREQNP